MSTQFKRSANESLPAKNLTFEQRFGGPDNGIVYSWDRGREMRIERPELAERAEKGELPMLPWRGGVEAELKLDKKYGTLRYLAMWRGLRNEDLHIDLDAEYRLVCSKFNQLVVFKLECKPKSIIN